MLTIIEAEATLKELGGRLKTLRLRKNESQLLFAQRIGVSIPTLRDIENGVPTVSIGHWMNAVWMLGRIHELDHFLEDKISLFELEKLKNTRMRARKTKVKS